MTTRYEEEFYRDIKLLVKELREIKEELRELRTHITTTKIIVPEMSEEEKEKLLKKSQFEPLKPLLGEWERIMYSVPVECMTCEYFNRKFSEIGYTPCDCCIHNPYRVTCDAVKINADYTKKTY